MTNAQSVYARPDLPEDVVYAFVKSFFENASELDSFHALGKTIRAETALEGLSNQIPVHPGAAKYFKEAGVWDDSFTIGTIK